MIEHLKHLKKEYNAENEEYGKVIKQDKAFFVQNLIRVKQDKLPTVDDMIILDENNDAVLYDKEELFSKDKKVSAPDVVFEKV